MKLITLYLGLDVHKDSITIAIAEPGSKGEIRLFGTITNDMHALEKALICVAFALYDTDRLFRRTIIEELNDLSDRPWRQAIKSKQADEAWLSRQLRPYSVQPRNIRIEEVQAKGYLKEDLLDTFRRYIPKSELDALREEALPAVPPAQDEPVPA